MKLEENYIFANLIIWCPSNRVSHKIALKTKANDKELRATALTRLTQKTSMRAIVQTIMQTAITYMVRPQKITKLSMCYILQKC